MLHKEFNNGLRAYPIHQAVQAMGSTALCRDSSLVFVSDAAAPTMVAERVGAEGAAR